MNTRSPAARLVVVPGRIDTALAGDPVRRFHLHVVRRQRRTALALTGAFTAVGAAAMFVATRMSDIGHFAGAGAMGLAALGGAVFFVVLARRAR